MRANTNAYNGICIDSKSGIFLISEHKRGTQHPIHVQKLIGIKQQVINCTSKNCLDFKAIANISGYRSYTCSHLESVNRITELSDIANLSDNALDVLVNK